MKKRLILMMVILLVCVFVMCGCQGAAKTFGGTVTIELEPNTKFEMITWKDDSLWYCTRPMREDEIAETHTYQQSSEWGVFEGTVIIIEKKEDQ